MRYLILILLILIPLNTMATNKQVTKKPQTKSSVWKKAGGQGEVPKVKGMSKREVWAAATGKSKTKAPSYTKTIKIKKALTSKQIFKAKVTKNNKAASFLESTPNSINYLK